MAFFLSYCNNKLNNRGSETVCSRLLFCIFGKVDHEQQQGPDGTKNDERPGQGHEVVWGCVEDSAMVEMVEDDDEGVVEKMGADVDKQRARAVEEVAQQRPHQQTGHEAVEVEMG